MKHLAAYLLLLAGGNEAPSAGDISTLLSSVGIDSNDERLTSLLAELEGKNVNELIALGREKLVVSGGAPAAAASAAPAAAGGAGKIYCAI